MLGLERRGSDHGGVGSDCGAEAAHLPWAAMSFEATNALIHFLCCRPNGLQPVLSVASLLHSRALWMESTNALFACLIDVSASLLALGARQQMAAEHRLRQQQAMVGEREREQLASSQVIARDCA